MRMLVHAIPAFALMLMPSSRRRSSWLRDDLGYTVNRDIVFVADMGLYE